MGVRTAPTSASTPSLGVARLHFFERLADGSLEQRTGTSNPFNGIDVGIEPRPSVADWCEERVSDSVRLEPSCRW